MLWDVVREPLGMLSIVYFIASFILLLNILPLERSLAITLIAVFLTASSSNFVVAVRDAYYRADLRITKVGHFKVENSIRIFAEVSNKGKVTAKYVKPLLTLDRESLASLVFADSVEPDKHWLNCERGGHICPICPRENRGFLCSEPFKVDGEYLCWSVAEVDAGSGLFGKYYHVTNLPPNDVQKVIIADIYKSDEENICIIKFFSEYGENKPRICLRLDLETKTSLPFALKLVGEGFNPIEKKFHLKISKDSLEIVLGDRPVPVPAFKELKRLPIRYTSSLLRGS